MDESTDINGTAQLVSFIRELEDRNIPAVFEDYTEKQISELETQTKLDEGTMQSWLADGSDDSAMSSCKEPLIPLEDESDMEEFVNNKENVNNDTEPSNEKEEPFVNDLINLNESEEKILKQASNKTAEANKSLLDIDNESEQNQTVEVNKNLLDVEIETVSNQTIVENKILLDVHVEETPNQTLVANKSLLYIDIEKPSPERKQDLNSETEKCARVCIEQMKGALNNIFQDVKKVGVNQTATDSDVVSRNGLKTLEEELKEDAEANYLRRTVPHSLAEIGLPKFNINDAARINKDEAFMKNIKKIGVYSGIFQASVNETSDGSDIKEEDVELFQPEITNEGPGETIHRSESNEFIDVVSIENSVTLNTMEKCKLDSMPDAETETKDLTDINIISSDKHKENIVETDDSTKKQKSAMIKSILKNKEKRVTFADKKGDPGMEHMALHQEESPKLEEKQLVMDTSLRFMTEAYPSHDEEEMLSESLNATLEPCALSRPRRRSPLAKELYEELKTLEGDEQSKMTLSVSPCQSPERSEFLDSTIKEKKNFRRNAEINSRTSFLQNCSFSQS
ncbi:hypothetical protein HNY73_001536 [Argiope bruennichi]|uniref:Uncharacterized protein n=1 Tax=Argiope bruennichi TaxID=94029 RepID=A0A8T0G238_ARGBR|nr:hypothetical protein HNY73_001536 [Argiope bruennichi]